MKLLKSSLGVAVLSALALVGSVLGAAAPASAASLVEGPQLAATGSSGMLLLLGIGAVLLVLAVALMVVSNRRRKRQDAESE